jgi:hypothetical protein
MVEFAQYLRFCSCGDRHNPTQDAISFVGLKFSIVAKQEKGPRLSCYPPIVQLRTNDHDALDVAGHNLRQEVWLLLLNEVEKLSTMRSLIEFALREGGIQGRSLLVCEPGQVCHHRGAVAIGKFNVGVHHMEAQNFGIFPSIAITSKEQCHEGIRNNIEQPRGKPVVLHANQSVQGRRVADKIRWVHREELVKHQLFISSPQVRSKHRRIDDSYLLGDASIEPLHAIWSWSGHQRDEFVYRSSYALGRHEENENLAVEKAQ